ncbi:MAG: hypothetical protein ACREBU_11475 [Nitrososphaera sp.]
MSTDRDDRYHRLFIAVVLLIALLGAYIPPIQPADAHLDPSIPNPINEMNWEVTWSDSGSSMTVISNVKYKGAADPYNILITTLGAGKIFTVIVK